MGTEPDRDLTERMRALMPLTAVLGIEAVAATTDEVRLRMDWTPERCTAGGLLHGGASMALADATGAWLAANNLPADAAGTTTVESSTRFLGAVREGVVHAVARPVHVGRTVVVVETELRDDNGRLVATTGQTQLVLGGR